MDYYIEHMCRDERYYKTVLYTIQALPDVTTQRNMIVRISQANLYFSVRIAHQMNMTEQFRSFFLEQLQKCMERSQQDNIEIDEIITPLYIAIILQDEERFVKMTNTYLIPMLLQSEDQHFGEALSVMYDSLEKTDLIRFFSILAQNKLFTYIDSNQLYGQCSEVEDSLLRPMLLNMAQEKDSDVILKMIKISYQCQVDGIFPGAIKKPKKYAINWSIEMQLYVFYGILNGAQIPDDIFLKIMQKNRFINKVEFYDFLTEYALHYSIPDEALYTLIVSSRVRKHPVVQEGIIKLSEGSMQSKLTLQMRHNLKKVEFFNMCRNNHYYNVVKFMIQNDPDEGSRRRYFSILAQSNISLAATVINSIYCNSEDLEELFNSILCNKIEVFSKKSPISSNRALELTSIIAALLITGRYEEFEIFMKEVFCPFILKNKLNPNLFFNNLSPEMMFKLVCSMAKYKAVSKIAFSLIRENKVNDEQVLSELLQTVYYDTTTQDSTKPLRLTIMMAEKYGVEDLAALLNTTDEAINDRIRLCFKNKGISLTNKMHLG